MQIGSNAIAQTAIRAMYSANAAISTASERISTGLRINSTADDPAGMALGHRLKTQITSMSKAMDNVNQGIVMTQIVDGSLSQIAKVLNEMYSLAAYDSDNAYYSTLMTSYLEEIDSISENARWNGTSLMYDSTAAMTKDIQAGPDSGNTISMTFRRIDTSGSSLALYLSGTTDLTLAANASTMADAIETAQGTVSDYQAYIGGMTNVLTFHNDALTSVSTAYSAAYGNTMNADLAQETANLAAAQIRRDGATAMLSQANSMNKEVVAFLLKSVGS